MKDQVSRTLLLRAVLIIKQWHDFPEQNPDPGTFKIYYEKSPEMQQIREALGPYDKIKDEVIEAKSIPIQEPTEQLPDIHEEEFKPVGNLKRKDHYTRNYLRKIGNKYPKAIGKFWEFQNNMPQEDDYRYLFDFFDDNGIIVMIGYSNQDEKFISTVHTSQDNISEYIEVGLFNTRPEAEAAAFNMAFEILNDKP